MTQKVLESAVRDLHKLINDLSDKVVRLETKVSDQNTLIANQTSAINSLKKQVEGSAAQAQASTQRPPTAASAPPPPPPPLTPPQAQTTSQRPVRKARIVAAANISTSQKRTTKKDKVTVISPKYDETKQRQLNGNPSTTSTDKTTMPQIGALTLNNDSEWKEVRNKRRPPKPRRILTGSGACNNELQIAERLKFIQAWSFRPETTVENVKNYINKIATSDKYIVEKREIRTDQHAAFVIGFPETMQDKLCAPESWPQGVKVCDWFRYSPRAERGTQAQAAGERKLSAAADLRSH